MDLLLLSNSTNYGEMQQWLTLTDYTTANRSITRHLFTKKKSLDFSNYSRRLLRTGTTLMSD